MSLRFYTHFDFVDFKVDQRKKMLFMKRVYRNEHGAQP